MKIIKAILIILYIPLGLLILITLFGLIHRWTNLGYKSISNLDLQQISIVMFFNLILIAIMIGFKRFLKNRQQQN
ncbi:MAG: hypothetical protein PHV20_13420 [Bacteroidales bacterium]|nr:hypothetical protein [Bacteroidales bacterium]